MLPSLAKTTAAFIKRNGQPFIRSSDGLQFPGRFAPETEAHLYTSKEVILNPGDIVSSDQRHYLVTFCHTGNPPQNGYDLHLLPWTASVHRPTGDAKDSFGRSSADLQEVFQNVPLGTVGHGSTVQTPDGQVLIRHRFVTSAAYALELGDRLHFLNGTRHVVEVVQVRNGVLELLAVQQN